jgi:hypothetical protein
MDNVQYVVDAKGKPVSAIVPIEQWQTIEQAKSIFEHLYISGLIESRKDDPVSCDLDELLSDEGISRYDLER